MLKFYHLILILISFLIFQAQYSVASDEYQEQLIRVGISTADFKYLEYPSTTITADQNFTITDLSDQSVLIQAPVGYSYRIAVNDNGFIISSAGKEVLSGIKGPVGIDAGSGHIKLLDVRRQGKVPSYRGKIELVRGTKSTNKLSVVNVLPLDEYLKGVVPNELPPSFGLEALKAQAVAARNYAVRPREKPYSQFDICDSVMCQVYFGYGTETAISNRAVEETAGLVVLHNGEVITALYSSTAGGFSENYECAFSDPVTNAFPAQSLPYLKGKHDLNTLLDLSSDKTAEEFYTSSPPSYDVKSSYYRWNRSWSRIELEKVLNLNLAKMSSDRATSIFIKPAFPKGTSIGTLKNIYAAKRGLSGKVMELAIEGTNGSWIVQKELNIRRLLTKNGKALPSANIVFKLVNDPQGNFSTINVYGGGFGHGVGMSQYGASYMAGRGFNYDKILQHYYSNTAIGTEPVILFSGDNSKPIRQVFYSPEGKGILWIDNEGVSGISLKINNKDFNLTEIANDRCFKKVDISSYLNKGKNEIIYSPPTSSEGEGLSVKLWVELFKAN